jgi:aspartate aminotransferase
MLMLAEAVPVLIPTREENDFKLTAAELKARITPRTRGIIMNSPSNPTGCVYTKKELEDLAEVVLAHKLIVISDDIYDRILFDGAAFWNLAMLGPELKAQTFVLNGLSKTYAMTGWRIGYAAGPQEVINAAVNLQSQSTSNPNSIAQKAGVAALTGPQDAVAKMLTEFAWRRDDIYKRVTAIPGVTSPKPGGAFYIFPNFSHYFKKLKPKAGQSPSQCLAEYLLDEAKVAMVPGAEFGEDNCLRLSFATSRERIATGVSRIQEALGKL